VAIILIVDAVTTPRAAATACAVRPFPFSHTTRAVTGVFYGTHLRGHVHNIGSRRGGRLRSGEEDVEPAALQLQNPHRVIAGHAVSRSVFYLWTRTRSRRLVVRTGKMGADPVRLKTTATTSWARGWARW